MNKQEWESVGHKLSDFTYLFYKVWELGVPTLDDTVPTACVTFDKAGHNVGFHFNPKFWKSLTVYQRAFVTAHECLHVILNHGVRGIKLEPKIANVAMDVVVNTMLTDLYGFDREKLGVLKDEGCWLDTVFPDGSVQYGQNMEYYYHELISKADITYLDDLQLVDDHSGLRGTDTSDVMGNVPADLKGDLDEAKDGDNPQPGGQQAGTGSGTEKNEKLEKIVPKQTWTELFKKFFKRNVTRPDEHEQWVRVHKRLQYMDPSMLLPAEAHDVEVEKPGKIPIWLFLDVSGSCDKYRYYFLKAFSSIPKDTFEIRLFSFDSQVREIHVSPDGTLRLNYGGGTAFGPIEAKIQSLIAKEKKSYPKLVLVFTDGFGTWVSPEHPDQWHWFLMGKIGMTDNDYKTHSTTRHIPPQSKWYKLESITG